VSIDGGQNEPDANTDVADATNPTSDADPNTPDAAPQVLLVVTATGQGRVQSLANGIDCANSCMYMFPVGTPLTLVAVPQNMNFMFVEWAGDACIGEPASCALTLNAPTSVTASFSN